jgi:thioesterase domain-containing protein
MSVAALMTELHRQDIRVWMEDDQLRCNAPSGALTDELREQLRQRKGDIVDFLRTADVVAAQRSAVVPLQQRGAGAPVFAVPAHTGDVFAYRALARALGAERPFFALQPPGLDGRTAPLDRVEDLAAYFEAQVRATRPHGPWIVAGYCMGGSVAFELAQRLLAGRESAGFVALFGAPYPSFFRPFCLLRHTIVYRAQGMRGRLRQLAGQSGRERLEYLRWRLKLHKQAPDPLALARAGVEAATLRAVRAYEPRYFAGRVHHFLPCECWARTRVQANRWRAVAAHMESHAGPQGLTNDDMLLAEHAPIFAAHFRQSCAREGM